MKLEIYIDNDLLQICTYLPDTFLINFESRYTKDLPHLWNHWHQSQH